MAHPERTDDCGEALWNLTLANLQPGGGRKPVVGLEPEVRGRASTPNPGRDWRSRGVQGGRGVAARGDLRRAVGLLNWWKRVMIHLFLLWCCGVVFVGSLAEIWMGDRLAWISLVAAIGLGFILVLGRMGVQREGEESQNGGHRCTWPRLPHGAGVLVLRRDSAGNPVEAAAVVRTLDGLDGRWVAGFSWRELVGDGVDAVKKMLFLLPFSLASLPFRGWLRRAGLRVIVGHGEDGEARAWAEEAGARWVGVSPEERAGERYQSLLRAHRRRSERPVLWDEAAALTDYATVMGLLDRAIDVEEKERGEARVTL